MLPGLGFWNDRKEADSALWQIEKKSGNNFRTVQYQALSKRSCEDIRHNPDNGNSQ